MKPAQRAVDRFSPADVSVIVVTYQSRTFIDRCLDSVVETVHDQRAEIIVVDNASADGTADHVRGSHPWVGVTDVGWNSGFSRACNIGAARASGRFLLFLNGDAWLGPAALDQMCRDLDADEGIGVVAPLLVGADGRDQQTARSFPGPSALLFGRRSPLSRLFPNNRFTKRYLAGGAGREGLHTVDWVSGAALLIRRDLYEQLGGFDERFFMYWEDADLCRRVAAAGKRVACDPSVWIAHAEGGSAGVTSSRQNRRFHRSAYLYACRHHLRGPAVVFRPLLASALVARALLVGASSVGSGVAPTSISSGRPRTPSSPPLAHAEERSS